MVDRLGEHPVFLVPVKHWWSLTDHDNLHSPERSVARQRMWCLQRPGAHRTLHNTRRRAVPWYWNPQPADSSAPLMSPRAQSAIIQLNFWRRLPMPRHASVGDIFMACPAEDCRYCSVMTVQKRDRDTAECHQVTIIHRHYLQGLLAIIMHCH